MKKAATPFGIAALFVRGREEELGRQAHASQQGERRRERNHRERQRDLHRVNPVGVVAVAELFVQAPGAIGESLRGPVYSSATESERACPG
jgi:hypothetical protein